MFSLTIILDEKPVGAVPHIRIDSGAKGYGIFIENMLARRRKDWGRGNIPSAPFMILCYNPIRLLK